MSSLFHRFSNCLAMGTFFTHFWLQLAGMFVLTHYLNSGELFLVKCSELVFVVFLQPSASDTSHIALYPTDCNSLGFHPSVTFSNK